MPVLWNHQIIAIRDVLAAFARGDRRVYLRMATGAGKSIVASELIRDWLICGLKVSLYTERPSVFASLLGSLCMTTADRSVQNIASFSVPECDDFQIAGLKRRHSELPYADVIVSDGWNDVSIDLWVRHAERPNARWLVIADKMMKPFFYDVIVACGTTDEARQYNGRKLWVDYYKRHKDSDMTFTAARVQFSIDYGFEPPDGSPFIPRADWDMCRRIRDIPRERLT